MVDNLALRPLTDFIFTLKKEISELNEELKELESEQNKNPCNENVIFMEGILQDIERKTKLLSEKEKDLASRLGK